MSEKEILKIIDSKPNNKPIEPTYIDNIDELTTLFLPIASKLKQKLQTESFFTLWEIWKYVSVLLNITFPIEVS